MKLTNTVSKPLVALAALVAIGAGAGLSAIASAATDTATAPIGDDRPMMGPPAPGMHGPGVHGTISSIDGSTVTITNKDGTSYTIDASDATVTKMVESGLTDLSVGDEIGVMGQVSGTEVVAKHIMGGIPPRPEGPPAGN